MQFRQTPSKPFPEHRFVRADGSSEDDYSISVRDAFGVRLWEDINVRSVSGKSFASVKYAIAHYA
jgi:hypothetical protein